MAETGKKQSNILWLLLIGGAIYYFYNKKKQNEAKLRALATAQGGEEVGGAGGGGGGFGGGGITPLTPTLTTSDGEDTEINVNVETPAPSQPSEVDCIKFPTMAGCEQTLAPQAAVEPSKTISTPTPMGSGVMSGGASSMGGGAATMGGGNPMASSGASTMGANPKGNVSAPTLPAQPAKKNFVDFDGDFDYMDKGYGRAKTDFDGEL